MNKKWKGITLTGGSSLLVIFAVLCLIVFTLLTLSTVNASRNLADRSHDAVAAYYEADARAEEIYAQLRAGNVPEGVVVEGNLYRYECPISDTQSIHVTLSCTEGQWNVLEWRSVSTLQ